MRSYKEELRELATHMDEALRAEIVLKFDKDANRLSLFDHFDANQTSMVIKLTA